MLEVDFDDRQEEYALKVPAYGTPKKIGKKKTATYCILKPT
jgi:hypothetical protein